MNLKALIVSILLLSMILLGSTTYLSSLGEGYNQEVDVSGFNKTSQRLNTTRMLVNDTRNKVMEMKLEKPTIATAFLVPYKMIQVGWNVMRMVFNAVGTIEAIFSDLTTTSAESGIPLPPWVAPTILAVIVVSLIILIVEAFVRWKLGAT